MKAALSFPKANANDNSNARQQRRIARYAASLFISLMMAVGTSTVMAQSIPTPTITANADLNNLVCGQTVTLTASGTADEFRWYSDAACTDLLGTGQTYTFTVTDQPVTIYCKAVQVTTPASSGSQDFNYTGAVQTYNIPSGAQSLTLEVWGAQGGTYSSSYVGGKGGYSVGTIPTAGLSSVYVYVGGQPAYGAPGNGSNITGGYNGGGQGHQTYWSSTYTYAQAGGGATDIRVNGNTLYDRVIVAGGGSGSTNGTNGWAGGGTTSLGYSSTYQATQTTPGSGGSFGQGGNPHTSVSNYKYCSAGGGGGWYGGGANSSYTDSDASYRQQNGGGSGFVWTSATASNVPSGYNVSSNLYLTDAQTIAGNLSFPAPGGGNETGHSGNGHARISYEIPEVVSLSSAVSVTAAAGNPPATPVVEVSNSCRGEDMTLTVTNAVNGLTYGWWDNASCTGYPLQEGTSYTINNIQNSATYYVRAYRGTMQNPVHDF
ncbi:MAG: hypothetical protein J5642_06535, partial [Bacteroidales bacterium]|nr:hypothetical protein [Bacteroidales bacterium]